MSPEQPGWMGLLMERLALCPGEGGRQEFWAHTVSLGSKRSGSCSSLKVLSSLVGTVFDCHIQKMQGFLNKLWDSLRDEYPFPSVTTFSLSFPPFLPFLPFLDPLRHCIFPKIPSSPRQLPGLFPPSPTPPSSNPRRCRICGCHVSQMLNTLCCLAAFQGSD